MIFFLLLHVLSILICYVVAKSRGVKPRFWGIMGFIFGPFAIPFVFFSKPKPKPKSEPESKA